MESENYLGQFVHELVKGLVPADSDFVLLHCFGGVEKSILLLVSKLLIGHCEEDIILLEDVVPQERFEGCAGCGPEDTL